MRLEDLLLTSRGSLLFIIRRIERYSESTMQDVTDLGRWFRVLERRKCKNSQRLNSLIILMQIYDPM